MEKINKEKLTNEVKGIIGAYVLDGHSSGLKERVKVYTDFERYVNEYNAYLAMSKELGLHQHIINMLHNDEVIKKNKRKEGK